MPISTTMVRETNLLAQPLRLPNGSVLRNRLAKSSMSETLASARSAVFAESWPPTLSERSPWSSLPVVTIA